MEQDVVDDPLSERLAALSPERRALLQTVLDPTEPAAAAPQAVAHGAPSDVEATLIAICEQVLGQRGLAREDDFFERGGDSIASMRVAAKAQRAGLAIAVRDIVTHRTIAAIASVAAAAVAAPVAAHDGTASTPVAPNAELKSDELDGLFAD
jgi:aryl carrier-like protein